MGRFTDVLVVSAQLLSAQWSTGPCVEVLKNSSGKWLWEMLRSPWAAGSALLTCGGSFLLYSNSLAVSAFLVAKRGGALFTIS